MTATEHEPETRVQVPPGVKVTLPVGVVAPELEVSVTVAVQVEDWFATTEDGEHVTIVVVPCALMFTVFDTVDVCPPESLVVIIVVKDPAAV